MRNYEMVVIGGGSAALGAARAARREGRRVAMVADGPVGGDCTFTGCVPSKTLIEAAAAGLDGTSAFERVRAVVDQIAGTESAAVLRREGIEVIEGRGRLVHGSTVEVAGETLTADHVVLATGSRPFLPPVRGLRSVEVLTSENLWDLTDVPVSLGVIGGGPLGCEMAQAFARLGSRVVLFEAAERVLPRFDPEASAVVGRALRDDGVDVRTGSAVEEVIAQGTQGAARLVTGGASVEVVRVLVAAGRVPEADGLGLEDLLVHRDRRGHVVVDAKMRTSVDGVWAAGDVTGKVSLASAADEMGRLAAWHAFDARYRYEFRPEWVPQVVFTDPEVAHVGASEADAPRSARVAYLPMTENDRAVAARRTEGFVKLIAGPKRLTRRVGGGRLLGATIVAPRAGEMIHEPALAVRTGMFAGRLAQTTHAYPTWSSAIQKAAAQLFYEIEGRQARRVRRSR